MDLKLYHVTLETELYCLAADQKEAERVALRYARDEEPTADAQIATTLYDEWPDSLPYHDYRKRDLPDRTCQEWFDQLGKKEG